MSKGVRRLTVSYHRPDSRSRVPVRRLAPMPFLRLQGRWLAQAGFAIGSQVRVEVTAGRLVLEVIEPEQLLPAVDRVPGASRPVERSCGDSSVQVHDKYSLQHQASRTAMSTRKT
jgi:toxic protein SymE